MTAQIPDIVIFNGDKYKLIGHTGRNLPTPQIFGIQPYWTSTNCYRGYLATYTCEKDKLFLTKLHISLAEDDDWQPINGVSPQIAYMEHTVTNNGDLKHERHQMDRDYNNLNIASDFSGGLLIGRDTLLHDTLPVVLPYQFKQVYELLYTDSKLTDIVDHSEKMAQWREQIIKNHEEYGNDLDALTKIGSSEPEFAERRRQMRETYFALGKTYWRFSLDYDNWF